MSELANELQEQGHLITVLTTTPHYNLEPEARSKQPLQKKWARLLYQSDYKGITVFHASVPVKGSRVGSRIIDYLRFHIISTIVGLISVPRHDVIFVPSPPLTIGISAWILSFFKKTPFIYNVQEIYPDVAVSLGVLKSPRVILILEKLEQFIYRRARIVTVISERFRQRLLSKNVSEEKLRVIPNFVDTDFMQLGERCNSFSEAHDLNDKFVVLYAGNIGLTQGFETILEAAQQLQNLADLRFVIVGDGTRRGWLEEQLSANQLDNLLLLPYQPRSTVPQIYATADLCLVPLKKGTAQETFPSKIYTIMAAGRPVLATADPDSELTWVVETAQCGWTAPPDDAEAMAAAIREAYGSREKARQMGDRGRTYVVANHSREAVASQYDKLIREVAGN